MPRFSLNWRGRSFEQKQEKAAAKFVAPKALRDKGGKVVPPLTLTPSQQKFAAAQRAWHVQAASSRPSTGSSWESRHESTGTAFAFMHPPTSSMLGGTLHRAQDATSQQDWRMGHGRDPSHQIPGTAGPPRGSLPVRRPWEERMVERINDPASYEPPPILDLRLSLNTNSERAIFQPRQEVEPDAFFRPVVSWPGDGPGAGWTRGGQIEREPWPGEGPRH